MCGIIGYIGHQQAMPILLEGLKSLEYRGYDSAGIAVLEDGRLNLIRSKGKIAYLESKIGGIFGEATVGIGHTRWATHGRPSDTNSHPHTDCKGEIAMVHNGIIENYMELRQWLGEHGHVFASETDTETLPHLVEHYYEGDLVAAVTAAISRVRGSYATVAISSHDPNMLVAAKKDSPLIIGVGEGEYFFASDIPAIIAHTRRMIIMEDGEVAKISREGVTVFRDGQPVEKEIVTTTWDRAAAEKGGYAHFMLKEIHEQPWALRQTIQGRIAGDESGIELKELSLSKEELLRIRKIVIVACGTAYHAGVVGKYVMEKILRLPVEVDIASEYRYRDPLIDTSSLVIVVSQSGETADTLAALRESKTRGAHVIAITNVLGSSISREAHDVIYTWAGPEIAVASTKAYITQLAAIYMLTLALAKPLGCLEPWQMRELIEQLYRVPEKVEDILDRHESEVQALAQEFCNWEDAFFIGRGLDYAVAMEGALKLKEISYIHAEAYAAGELKHGTLALVVEGVPVVALCTQGDIMEKTISNIKEIKARDAYVIGVAQSGMADMAKVCDRLIELPSIHDFYAPILSVVPLQLLAYYAATARGCDVDQPRNLAKSVTVE